MRASGIKISFKMNKLNNKMKNNYDEVVNQVQKDQQNNYKPEIKTKIENIED